jgi:hypothetical protein
MSDRPTPETDALITLRSGFGVTDYEWRQHSRKLERQRDEAREELINLRVENDHNWQANADLEEMIKLARELRDKLRALADECLLPGFNQEWDTFVEAESALTKAKEVLS